VRSCSTYADMPAREVARILGCSQATAWATQMIGAKQSPAAIAAFLGHSQVSFTMTTYVHADAAMAAPVAEAAQAALGSVIG
jgi:integrase